MIMNPESTSQESKVSFSMDDFAKALEQHDYHFQKGQVVHGKVFQYDSNGAFVDIGGKSPGFVPINEVALAQVDQQNLAEILPLETEREFLIVREQDAQGQVLLSVRQLYLKQAWEELAEIQESGKSVQIRITGTNRGGVTGEVNGLRGFIPRSHLLDQSNMDSLVGQLVTATFLEVDRERKKLVLSQRKAARADAMSQLEAGKLMEGKVASVKPYGVFVDMSGVTGLLHISQVSGSRISFEELSQLFPVRQSIKVMILEIDEWEKRISLSTKVLESHSGEILENMEQIMTNAEVRAEQYQAKQLESDSKENS